MRSPWVCSWGAWFRIKEVGSAAEVGLCCAHNVLLRWLLGFFISQGNAEALYRLSMVGKQSVLWFPTFSVTLLPKIIVIGSCMSRLYSKSKVGHILRHGIVSVWYQILTTAVRWNTLVQTCYQLQYRYLKRSLQRKRWFRRLLPCHKPRKPPAMSQVMELLMYALFMVALCNRETIYIFAL